jgi:ribonuclease HI
MLSVAKKKYYAVKVGKEPGIYETWDACKAQVHGHPGAVYKSFPTKSEALDFLSGAQVKKKEAENQMAAWPESSDTVYAYVDGSFDVKTMRYGSGIVLLYEDQTTQSLSVMGQDPELVEMRNVSGEIYAAELAMRQALEEGFRKIVIFHDYAGIRHWPLREWKANKAGTQAYRVYYESIKDRLEVEFVKVAAHTGDTYNEMADVLAKKALGIAK